jgi:hypothetical protein
MNTLAASRASKTGGEIRVLTQAGYGSDSHLSVHPGVDIDPIPGVTTAAPADS